MEEALQAAERLLEEPIEKKRHGAYVPIPLTREGEVARMLWCKLEPVEGLDGGFAGWYVRGEWVKGMLDPQVAAQLLQCFGLTGRVLGVGAGDACDDEHSAALAVTALAKEGPHGPIVTTGGDGRERRVAMMQMSGATVPGVWRVEHEVPRGDAVLSCDMSGKVVNCSDA